MSLSSPTTESLPAALASDVSTGLHLAESLLLPAPFSSFADLSGDTIHNAKRGSCGMEIGSVSMVCHTCPLADNSCLCRQCFTHGNHQATSPRSTTVTRASAIAATAWSSIPPVPVPRTAAPLRTRSQTT
jgi:hypothetical protein